MNNNVTYLAWATPGILTNLLNDEEFLKVYNPIRNISSLQEGKIAIEQFVKGYPRSHCFSFTNYKKYTMFILTYGK